MEKEDDVNNNIDCPDALDNWKIDDHVIPNDFGDQDAFPPLRNGAPPLTVDEDIKELSERVASSILDDEDEGVNKRVPWLERNERKIEPMQLGAIYEGAPRKPLKILAVQELKQMMQNYNYISGRAEATNNQMDLLFKAIAIVKENWYTEQCLMWLPRMYQLAQENISPLLNLPLYIQFFETASMKQVIDLAKAYEGVVIWDKKVMVAVVAMMVGRVAEIYDDQGLSASVTDAQRTNWIEFLQHQANNIPQDRSTISQPVPVVKRELLVKHLSSLFSETDEGTKTNLITAFGNSCFQTNQNPLNKNLFVKLVTCTLK